MEKSWFKLVAVLVVTVVIATTMMWLHQRRSRVLASFSCGPWAVVRLLELSDSDASVTNVARSIDVRRSSHSLVELRDCLTKLGIDASLRKIAFSELQALEFPCIASLTSPDHYVVVSKDTNGNVVFIDGSPTFKLVTDSHVDHRWRGAVLTLKDTNTKLPSDGCKLAGVVDLGWVGFLAKNKDFVVSLQNFGDSPLVIEKIEGDCSCLSAIENPKTCGIGETVQIKLRVALNEVPRSTAFYHNFFSI